MRARRVRFLHIACIAFCLLVLAGCRPTDALREIVYDPNTTQIDARNPVAVNSPFAEEEVEWLPALELDTTATRAATSEQNVAVYGSEPTSELLARHSAFGIKPKFEGVESSDAVSLYESDSEEAIDHEIDKPKGKSEQSAKASEEEPDEDEDTQRRKSGKKRKKKSSGKQTGTKSGSAASEGGDTGAVASVEVEAAEEADGDTGYSGSDEGGTALEDEEDDTAEGNAEDAPQETQETETADSDDASGGTGGVDKVWGSGSLDEDLPQANAVAAIGRAAVLVQALGGRGAICAMDEDTYNGANSTSAFKDVFGDELADDFESDALLFGGDGTDAAQIKDIDKLVDACGTNGVIVVVQEDINPASYFTEKQAAKINKAGIVMLTLSFASTKGIEQAATVVGKVLKGSDCEQDAKANAAQYRSVVDALLAACKDATEENKNVAGVIATDFDIPAGYENKIASYDIDVSDGVLFTHMGDWDTPLCSYMEAAGVTATMNREVKKSSRVGWTGNKDSVTPLWQYLSGASSNRDSFTGYGNDSPFARILGGVQPQSATTTDTTYDPSRNNMRTWAHNGSSSEVGGYGVGSSRFPYLVVSATRTYSGTQVREHVLSSAKTERGVYHIYLDGRLNMGKLLLGELGHDREADLSATIGLDAAKQESLFDNGGKIDIDAFGECVRINPCGLLGPWTEGNVESVLEAVWLTQIYSEDAGNYTAPYSMEDFSVDIGDASCRNVRDAVEAFYSTVYRCPASDYAYSRVVEDE